MGVVTRTVIVVAACLIGLSSANAAARTFDEITVSIMNAYPRQDTTDAQIKAISPQLDGWGDQNFVPSLGVHLFWKTRRPGLYAGIIADISTGGLDQTVNEGPLTIDFSQKYPWYADLQVALKKRWLEHRSLQPFLLGAVGLFASEDKTEIKVSGDLEGEVIVKNRSFAPIYSAEVGVEAVIGTGWSLEIVGGYSYAQDKDERMATGSLAPAFTPPGQIVAADNDLRGPYFRVGVLYKTR